MFLITLYYVYPYLLCYIKVWGRSSDVYASTLHKLQYGMEWKFISEMYVIYSLYDTIYVHFQVASLLGL